MIFKSLKFKLFCLPIFVLAGFFIGIFGARAAYTNWEITTDTTWTLLQSPIVIKQNVYIKSGVTLTIEPGVIMKIAWPYNIVNNGQLIVKGSRTRPIIFTSISDDERGGDTNSDGSSVAGVWGYILLNTKSSTTFDYAIINYSNFTSINIGYAKARITNSVISKNVGGIRSYESDLVINNSAIFDNFYKNRPRGIFYEGIYNTSLINRVDARDNWWGTSRGPCPWQALVPPNTPIWSVDIPALCEEKPLVTGPVDYESWLQTNPLQGLGSSELKPVILIPGIMGSWNVDGKWQLDPILNTYDNLWQALKAAGYEEGKTLFAFPYQWRLSNVYSAMELGNKIEEIKAICNCDKVDIVAHSMGGLVARAYVEILDKGSDIDKLIFLATPHLGATKAYLMWEGGKFGTDLGEKVMGGYFALEAGFSGHSSISKYIRDASVKSVQELLPIYDYLRDRDSSVIRMYPDNYPRNEFLENLNAVGNLNKLDNIRMFNFLGDVGDTSTVNILRIVENINNNGDWQNGYPENYDLKDGDHGLEYSVGDTTVPKQSNEDFFGLSNEIIYGSNHGNLVTDVQKLVIKNLTGKEPENEIRNSGTYNALMVRIFSPADFIIISPDGQRLGKDFTTGQDVREISESFYSGSNNGPEFAVIRNPQAGDYKINLQGTDTGSYRLSFSYLDDDWSIDRDFNANIVLGQNQEFNINYSSSSESLGNLEPQDVVAPMINIINPVDGSKFLRSQKINLNYSVVDDFSGVATTTIFFNNQVLNTSTIDLFNYRVGEYQIKIVATDQVNNLASSTVKFNIITDLADTLLDIDSFYQQGLMSIDAKNKLSALLRGLDVKLSIYYLVHSNELDAVRRKFIVDAFKIFDNLLENVKEQDKIDQNVYDIIKVNSDYLKINL